MTSEAISGNVSDDSAAEAPVRVMVLDDEPVSRTSLCAVLKRMDGVEVVPCSQPLDALEMVLSQPVDLILIDIHLEVISGLDLLGMIRSDPACSELPAIVISADRTISDIRRAVGLGIWDYCTKPIGRALIRSLERAVERVRDSRGMRSAMGRAVERPPLLLIEPDEAYRRFASVALGPFFSVESADQASAAMVSAAGRRADWILASTAISPAAIEKLQEKTTVDGRAPRVLRLSSPEHPSPPETITRTWDASSFAAQTLRRIADYFDADEESGWTESSAASVGAVVAKGLEDFFSSIGGEQLLSELEQPDGEFPCWTWMNLQRGSGDTQMRLTLGYDDQLAAGLARAMLGDDANSADVDFDSAVREALNVVGGRLRGYCWDRQLAVGAGVLASGTQRPDDPPEVRRQWRLGYRWHGEPFLLQAQIF